jgi:hypothetical protein
MPLRRSERRAGGRPGLRRSGSDPWMDERVDDRRRMQSSLRRGPYRVNSCRAVEDFQICSGCHAPHPPPRRHHSLSPVGTSFPGSSNRFRGVCKTRRSRAGGGISVRTTSLRPLPPPDRGSPRANDTPRSPIHAGTDSRKTRREPRTRRTRFSALHTPRPESGRGRSEVAHYTPRGRSRGGVEVRWFERRSLPDSGRGRASTDPARDAFTGCGVVIG